MTEIAPDDNFIIKQLTVSYAEKHEGHATARRVRHTLMGENLTFRRHVQRKLRHK